MIDPPPVQPPLPKRRFDANDLLFVLACVATILYAWTAYVPLIPDAVDVNSDWLWALSVAHIKGLAFGRDIMFTYGPLGYTLSGYYPATFPNLVMTWTLLAGALWTALFLGLRRIGAPRLVIVAGIAGIFILSAGEHPSMPDPRVSILPVMLLAYHFCIDDSPKSAGKILLATALALAALIKFTYFVAAAMVCAAISLDELMRTRKPFTIALFTIAYLIGWRLSGQSFASLTPYFSSSLDVAAGYGEAMSFWSDTEVFDILTYIIPAVLLLVMVWIASAGQALLRRSLHTAALSVFLWMTFKGGYVRHDAHDILATSLLPLATLAYALANYSRLVHSAWSAGWAICLVASIYAASRAHAHGAGESIQSRCHRSFIRGGRELVEVMRIATRHPSAVSQQYDQFVRRDSILTPLPKVDGPSDLLRMWSHRVVANGLDYLPRPSLQSYAAYTPSLAHANAAFLRIPQGPLNVFFAPEVIDERLPALDDGPAMLELFSKFDLIGSTGAYLQFRRSDSPRSFSLKLLAHEQPRFLDAVVIPSAEGKLIWAVIDVKPTVYGKVIGALYKTPMLLIGMRVHGESPVPERRFIPGCGRAGFIISPLLYDLDSFANLGWPWLRTLTDPVYPTEFRIGAKNAEVPRSWYGSTYDVKLYEVQLRTLPR